MKSNLKRLVPAVLRELRDAAERKELKRLDRRVQQLERYEAMGGLVGGIAHDFNNMVGAILGWAEMGLEESKPDGGLHHRFQKIRDQSLRAGELISKLLTFAGGRAPQPRKINLNVLIEEEMSLLTTLIGEGIEVRLLTAPDLKVTLADPMQIEQVLMNLCVNARDAMKDRGELVIETRNVELGSEFCREHCVDPPGSYVLLRVSDTGIGIDSATMEHIFEPFFTTKAIGKGSELGLATWYGIVKQHGGFVFVESKVGVGSSFRVCLPVSTGGMSIAKLEMMIIVRGAAKQFYWPKITTDFEKRRERSWRRLAIACWSHRTVQCARTLHGQCQSNRLGSDGCRDACTQRSGGIPGNLRSETGRQCDIYNRLYPSGESAEFDVGERRSDPAKAVQRYEP